MIGSDKLHLYLFNHTQKALRVLRKLGTYPVIFVLVKADNSYPETVDKTDQLPMKITIEYLNSIFLGGNRNMLLTKEILKEYAEFLKKFVKSVLSPLQLKLFHAITLSTIPKDEYESRVIKGDYDVWYSLKVVERYL